MRKRSPRPNLQYLMDSPSEFSGGALRTFTVSDGPRTPVFRLAIHEEGDDAELDSYARDVEKIVREERGVYGEFAPYDGGTYTFIADYLPWASGDGMEHRNSTIMTSTASIRGNRAALLDTVSHEFFHSWNVERIRPKSLEPFNFDDANMSGELWLAEGFTNYYGPLVLERSGLMPLPEYAATIGAAIDTVTLSPGREVHTAEEMSQMAPFVDAAAAIDRTDFDNTFISYYTWGESIALGLDLTLRERSDGRITLDDFMRAMWQKFGKPGGHAAGYVDHPYTIADAKEVLAAVAGDTAFADDFFAHFIQGHEIVNYARLLSDAGFVLRAACARRRLRGRPAPAECRRWRAHRRRGSVGLAGVSGRPRSRRHHLYDRCRTGNARRRRRSRHPHGGRGRSSARDVPASGSTRRVHDSRRRRSAPRGGSGRAGGPDPH